MKDKAKVNKFKLRNFSQFSADCLNTELSQMDWNAIAETKSCDVNEAGVKRCTSHEPNGMQMRKNSLFSLISIRFGSSEVRRLTRA